MKKERISEAGEFAKEHLPKIMAITTAGVSVILLIQYFLNKKKKDSISNTDENLDILVEEAKTGDDSSAVLLETGEAAMNAIPESSELAEELAESMNDPDAKKTMKTLSQLGKK